MSDFDPRIYLVIIIFCIVLILCVQKYYKDECFIDISKNDKHYQRVFLKKTNFYFLTVNNETRKAHINQEFKDYSPTEINPVTGISRNKSGASGFIRMVDRGLREQDRTQPFQPFVLLEDDASKFREFPEYIDIPIQADLVYLGLHGWGYSIDKPIHIVYSEEYDNDLIRVKNMLATHGVMVCSAAGAALMERCMMESYYLDNPWDIPITHAQPFYNVYALKTPLVYQDGKYGGKERVTKMVAPKSWCTPMPEEHIKRTGASNLMSSVQQVL
jgi:hypothetical protein